MAKKPKKAYRNRILPSKKTINEGIYIDFEGFAPNSHNKKIPPSLIGIYRPADDCFRQIVFNNGLQIAAENTDVGYPVIFSSDIKSFLKQLVSEARKKQPLFAFSEHEYKKIKPRIGSRSIKKRYRNVNLIAKKYFKDNQPDKPVPSTLLEVIQRLDLDTTDKIEDHTITDRIREVKKHCKSHKKWASAPKEKKKLWHEVLEHNKWDCMIMHKALLKMLKTKGSGECN